MTPTPRSALAAILTLTGNVDHATKSGANDALARGHLLNAIREIASAVPPATTADPDAVMASLIAMVAYYDPDNSESMYDGPGGSPVKQARALIAQAGIKA